MAARAAAHAAREASPVRVVRSRAMYREPAQVVRRFSIREQERKAARSHVVIAYLLAIVVVAVASFVTFDHWGPTRRTIEHVIERRDPTWLDLDAPVVLGWGAVVAALFYVASKKRRERRGEAPGLRKKLAAHGDPDAVRAELEQELDLSEVVRVGDVTLSRSWIVWEHPFGFDLARLRDVVWAHAKTTSYSVNGVRVAKTRGVEVHTRASKYGPAMSIACTEAEGRQILEALGARVPWIDLGHDAELERRWLHGRAEALAEVERRRAERERSTA
jgi:hypothetical protein